MDRTIFKSLGDTERVEWFMQQYEMDKKHSEIVKEFGLAKNTVADTFKRNGYTYNKSLGKYENIDNITCDNITSYNDVTLNQHISNIKGGGENETEVVATLELDINLQNDLVNMISWYKEQKEQQEELQDLLVWYRDNKNNENIIEVPQLEIDKNILNGEVKTRSFTIHTSILNMFNEFATNKPYSKQDLLGQALLEFIRKYN